MENVNWGSELATGGQRSQTSKRKNHGYIVPLFLLCLPSNYVITRLGVRLSIFLSGIPDPNELQITLREDEM
ncbi:unnamed protein product [Dicrocoelium dendriticum]|nr:unnamed protein product [Dicrocoelium dendriticum]